jgi:hypothetical protein
MALVELTDMQGRYFPRILKRFLEDFPLRKQVFLICEGYAPYKTNTHILVKSLRSVANAPGKGEDKYIFIDRSTEVGRFDKERVCAIGDFSRATSTPLNNIVYVSQCARSPEYLTHDFHTAGFERAPSWLFFHDYIWRFHHLYKHVEGEDFRFSFLRTLPPRLLCLNAKPRPHRLALLVKILTRMSLRDFHLSFADREALEDTNAAYKLLTPSYPRTAQFAHVCAQYAGALPTCFAENYGEHINDNSFPLPETISTFCQIVTETNHTPEHVRITEKSLKPIIASRPFLLCGPQGALSILKDYGFETFAPYINELYDQAFDPEERLELLAAEIERLLDLAKDPTAFIAFLDSVRDICAFNQRHFCRSLIPLLTVRVTDTLRHIFKQA